MSTLSSSTSSSSSSVLSSLPSLSYTDEIIRGQKRTYDVFYTTQRLQLPEAPEAYVYIIINRIIKIIIRIYGIYR